MSEQAGKETKIPSHIEPPATVCPAEFLAVGNRLRWDMRPLRKQLGLAIREIIEDLILLTFDQGRVSTPIEGDQGALARFLGRDDSDFEKYWSKMERMRIRFREVYALGLDYCVDPWVSNWDLVLPKSREELAREKATILSPSGQKDLPWSTEDDPKLFERDRARTGFANARQAIQLPKAENSASTELRDSRDDSEAENSAPRPSSEGAPSTRQAEFSAPLRSEIVREIVNPDLMNSGLVTDGTQLSRRDRARAEAGYTQAAQAVSARYRDDAYIMEKLSYRHRLKQELMDGRTPMARKFAVMYSKDAEQARELLGVAVTMMPNPAGYLNRRLREVRY